MGCGCKNKNNGNNDEARKTAEEMLFRKAEVTTQTGLSKKLTMMQSFASAITSRGLNNEKVTKPMKQLRVLSCFGNKSEGGVLPPCEHLKESKTPGKFYCGGCGCGDRKGTWLVGEGEEYSKLDYPRLNCPLQMPGFTNYETSKPDEAIAPVTRRHYIEQLSYKDIDNISVSVHEPPINQENKEQN
jgi:hypothetical protein